MPEHELSATDRNRLKSQEALVHLDALEKDPHFAWFYEHVLAKHRDEERSKALNVSLPLDKAEQARWRHDLAQTICDASKTLRALHTKTAGVG